MPAPSADDEADAGNTGQAAGDDQAGRASSDCSVQVSAVGVSEIAETKSLLPKVWCREGESSPHSALTCGFKVQPIHFSGGASSVVCTHSFLSLQSCKVSFR